MKTPTKDLFDDSTMSFGEHLEALRTHLIRAIIGLVIAAIITPSPTGEAIVTARAGGAVVAGGVAVGGDVGGVV